VIQVDPGKSVKLKYTVFYGPRDLSILEPLGHNLASAVDFGWFDIIAKPMLSLLRLLYDFIGNYGLAIIVVTILTKILFWPLTRKAYKSMKEMRKLQPHINKLREKYKGDRQKMNQEMMALYKSYKVNPMGGCLPMVVQIPVFIAFYKVLGASIELRHAPFLLWINDLSAPDRLNIGIDLPYVGGLPVMTLLMGASMFIQQKMTPTMGDPTQAKIMLLMPIMFTFIFINFPSGLVLYWLVQNVLSIGQQYWTNKSKA
jgi:YidC/Oxa1 family membrane protein insertase